MSREHHAVAYRPDIDGLRAIAVMAVVLFHARVPYLDGGFVGVDVFFVISGYLITGGLIKDASIVRFYQRRARRILPALYCMLLVSIVAALFILLPHDFLEFVKSAGFTLVFSSNIWFWRQSGYFAKETELWPLLHTWSLGVEEQFYIIFPLIMKLLTRFRPQRLSLAIAALAILSFVLAVYSVDMAKGVLAFYQMPMRAWELLVGALLATGAIPPARQKAVRSIIAVAGLAAIMLSLSGILPLPFPGLGAVPSVLGAAAFICAGFGGTNLTSPVMTAKPMVAVGLISYSLYLWHWPLFAFARYVTVAPLTPLQSAEAVALSFILATLSWRYVERPFRHRRVSVQTIWLFSLAGVASLGAVVGISLQEQGFPTRFPKAIVMLNEGSGATWRCPVTSFVSLNGYYACPLNLPSGNPRDADVVLWGDSHAQMYAPALLGALGSRPGLLVIEYGCPPLSRGPAVATCGDVQKTNFAAIRALPAKTVFLAENWAEWRDEAGAAVSRLASPSERYGAGIQRLRNTVADLRAAQKSVVLIAPIATPRYDVASEVSRELLFHQRITSPIAISRSTYDSEFANVLSAMQDMARDPGVRIIRIDSFACDDKVCPLMKNGHALFADAGHYSARTAATFTPLFKAVF